MKSDWNLKLSSRDLRERTDMRGFVGRTAFWSTIFNYSPTISIPKAITMIARYYTKWLFCCNARQISLEQSRIQSSDYNNICSREIVLPSWKARDLWLMSS